jgi:hypothetical protein
MGNSRFGQRVSRPYAVTRAQDHLPGLLLTAEKRAAAHLPLSPSGNGMVARHDNGSNSEDSLGAVERAVQQARNPGMIAVFRRGWTERQSQDDYRRETLEQLGVQRSPLVRFGGFRLPTPA